MRRFPRLGLNLLLIMVVSLLGAPIADAGGKFKQGKRWGSHHKAGKRHGGHQGGHHDGGGQCNGGGRRKVEVCHIPPGNPDNFHTIRISERALKAHLAHGDYLGPCNALCSVLCDDGDACTIDDIDSCENGCPVPDPVDCDDGNPCTADSCDAIEGCVNEPLVGMACDDGLVCTGMDMCNEEGMCVGEAIEQCCTTDFDCSDSLCQNEFCDEENRCVPDPVICEASPCFSSVCDEITGDCAETPILCDEGEECNPENNLCEPVDVGGCPCEGLSAGDATWDSSFTVTGCNITSVNEGLVFDLSGGFEEFDGLSVSVSGEFGEFASCSVGSDTFGPDPQVTGVTPLSDEELAACSESLVAIALEDGFDCSGLVE